MSLLGLKTFNITFEARLNTPYLTINKMSLSHVRVGYKHLKVAAQSVKNFKPPLFI